VAITGRAVNSGGVPAWIRAINSFTKRMVRLGVPMGPMILLTVRGRKTGRLYTTPLGMFERDGRRWLFAEFGAVDWVHNLRVFGEATVSRGRTREAVTVSELPAEAAAVVLHDIVAPWFKTPMGAMARMVAGRPIFKVALDAPLERFIDEAALHPVFDVTAQGAGR
jgi:deazaflavin-dependent oxidoreductase (nitroreductase family)